MEVCEEYIRMSNGFCSQKSVIKPYEYFIFKLAGYVIQMNKYIYNAGFVFAHIFFIGRQIKNLEKYQHRE